MTAAVDAKPAAPQLITTNTFNVSQKEGVWYYMGSGELKISGIIGQPINGLTPGTLTIVAPNASVRITDNLTIDAATQYSVRYVPSLGLIVQGDIFINPNVTKVEAFIFTDGTVYTCDGSNAACANPGVLTINGFVMAKDIVFGRLGAFDSAGTAAAETVVLSPQLYLNPPKLFDTGTDPIILLGQGERAPLY
jgi:hypothetical protein